MVRWASPGTTTRVPRSAPAIPARAISAGEAHTNDGPISSMVRFIAEATVRQRQSAVRMRASRYPRDGVRQAITADYRATEAGFEPAFGAGGCRRWPAREQLRSMGRGRRLLGDRRSS